MDILTRATLLNLAKAPGGFAVSIYLPTSRDPASQTADHLQLKNLIHTCETQLANRGATTEAIRQLGKRLSMMVNDSSFWAHMGDGLAIFAARDRQQVYHLPIPFIAESFVGRGFYLVPLLDALSDRHEANLLCVSQHQVRLWHVDSSGIQPIAAPRLPLRIETTLDFDERQNLSRQSHGGVRHGRFDRSTTFHGQGGPSDVAKSELRQFLRSIDEALPESVQHDDAPLVFAGVGYLYPLFAEVTRHPRLHERFLPGNPSLVAPAELRSRVLELLEAESAERRRRVLDRCSEQINQLKQAPTLNDVFRVIVAGEVEALLAPRGKRLWGQWDEHTLETVVFPAEKPGAEELVNLAVTLALRHGADVTTVDACELPADVEIGIVLRSYAVARGL